MQIHIHNTQCCALIFDLDGLLLDTETINKRALHNTFKQFGRRLTTSRHHALLGLSEDRTSHKLYEWFGTGLDIDLFHETCKQSITKLSAKGIVVKSGVWQLMEQLRRAGIPLALATSRDRGTTEEYLERSALDTFFIAVVTRDDVSEAKPSPEVYLRAAQLLSMKPSECLALEDSTDGALSALSAGMPTILVPDILPPSPALIGKVLAVHPNLDSVLRELTFGEQGGEFDVGSYEERHRHAKL